MKKTVVSAIITGVLLVTAGIWWGVARRHKTVSALVLYGNVDLRQVDLPFNASERVKAVLVQEGDHVTRGQLLAQLDPTRLEPQVRSNMPRILQYFTAINPLRYAIEIARRVYLEGVGLGVVTGDLWPLALIAAVTLTAASWMFTHRMQ